MEAAWKVGMKCIINDFTIESNSFASDNTSTIERRMNSPRLQEAFMHPAFYGIELADEPFKGTDMVNVGKYNFIKHTALPTIGLKKMIGKNVTI